MRNGLNRIFLTTHTGTNRLIVLIYLFVITLIPRLVHVFAGRFRIENVIKSIIITGITIFLTDYLLRKLQSINYSILLTIIACSLAKLFQEVLMGTNYYVGVLIIAIQVMALLVSWSIMGKSKMHYLLVLIIAFIVSELSVYITSYLYYAIFQDMKRDILMLFAKFELTGVIYLVFTISLFYILGIFKLIRKKQ